MITPKNSETKVDNETIIEHYKNQSVNIKHLYYFESVNGGGSPAYLCFNNQKGKLSDTSQRICRVNKNLLNWFILEDIPPPNNAVRYYRIVELLNIATTELFITNEVSKEISFQLAKFKLPADEMEPLTNYFVKLYQSLTINSKQLRVDEIGICAFKYGEMRIGERVYRYDLSFWQNLGIPIYTAVRESNKIPLTEFSNFLDRGITPQQFIESFNHSMKLLFPDNASI